MVRKLFDLTGKVAVVTGASRGLGRAMAIGLADAGASIVLVGRNLQLLGDTANTITSMGSGAIVAAADVSREEDVDTMAASAMKEFGKIDILVNNVGIAPMNTTMNISAEEWKTVLDTNLTSVFYACRAVGRHMIGAKSGKIINISSALAQSASNVALHYCSTKAAIVQMTRALALEWARFNIRVNCIAPGFFKTDMTRAQQDDEKHMRFLMSKIPMARLGDPKELVGIAVFLASDASSYVTGATLFVDGGYTVW